MSRTEALNIGSAVVPTSETAGVVVGVSTAPIPASISTTPSRGIFEEGDPFLSCVAPAAVVRGVTSAPVEQATDSSQPCETPVQPRSRNSQKVFESGSSSSSSRETSPATRGFRDVTAETVRADQVSVRADDAPTTAGACSAPPVRSNVPHRSPTLTDEEIVSRLCDNPNFNIRGYAEQLYTTGFLDYAAANTLVNQMTRVKKILSNTPQT